MDTAGSNVASGKATISCSGPGAPITLSGSGQGSANFQSTLTNVLFTPLSVVGPTPVLQFTGLNLKIVNSEFSNLVGTPYTLVFNKSTVEFVNTVFNSNTGTPTGALHLLLRL